MKDVNKLYEKGDRLLFKPINVIDYLKNKDIDFSVMDNGWLKMRCLFPEHNDKNPSFFVHSIDGGYNCYVCGSGSWGDLLNKMGWEYDDDISIKVNLASYNNWNKYESELNKAEQNEILDSGMPVGSKLIHQGVKHWDYLESRNLLDAIDKFQLSYTVVDYKYMNRVIIPVKSFGKVIWVEARSILNNKKKRWVRPFGVKDKEYLFNYDEAVNDSKYVIVVESPIDCISLYLGGYNSVACFGSTISDVQLSLLSLFEIVYVCLDNDSAGIKGFRKIKNKLINSPFQAYRVLLPKGKDVNKLGIKLFGKYFHKTKKITNNKNVSLI